MRFDFYGASVEASPDELLAGLVRRYDLSSVRSGRPLHGYARGAEVYRGERVLARLWWDGTGPDPHVQGSGEDAEVVAEYLRGEGFVHVVARGDVCEDYSEPGSFDVLHKLCLNVADRHGIKVRHHGDWHRGHDGRTLYLGSPTSVVQLRCYEKGKQLGTNPDLTRVEVQVRPKGPARSALATAQPSDYFGCSGWSKHLAEQLGVPEIERMKAGTIWRPADSERARQTLVHQYGRILSSWADEAGGWDALGLELGRRVSE